MSEISELDDEFGEGQQFFGRPARRPHKIARLARRPRIDYAAATSAAPLLYTVEQACALLSVGKTRLYELIGEGALDARKLRGSTRITARSLRLFVDNLPVAEIPKKNREKK